MKDKGRIVFQIKQDQSEFSWFSLKPCKYIFPPKKLFRILPCKIEYIENSQKCITLQKILSNDFSSVFFSYFPFYIFSNSLKPFIFLFLYKKILFFRMQIFVCKLIFLNSVQYNLYTLNLFTLIMKEKKSIK